MKKAKICEKKLIIEPSDSAVALGGSIDIEINFLDSEEAKLSLLFPQGVINIDIASRFERLLSLLSVCVCVPIQNFPACIYSIYFTL